MNKKIFAIFMVLALVLGTVAFAADLSIDFQCNVEKADAANYFTFKGPIRYMAADKDVADAKTGASAKGSTHFFMPYLYDVKGKTVLPSGLRGLFLFAVNPIEQAKGDNLVASKDKSGVITVNYIHRGTAYQIVTDNKGMLTFPGAVASKRAIGYIKGAGPQVISKDFSTDGTAMKADYAKVWNSKIAGGKEITAGVTNKTGDIGADEYGVGTVFTWSGSLQVTLDKGILKIVGDLDAK